MKRKRQLTGSITVRLSAPLQRRLRAKAKARGKSPSDFVRALIEREVEPETLPTLYERSAHIFAQLSGDPTLPHGADAREELEKWNPDRRD